MKTIIFGSRGMLGYDVANHLGRLPGVQVATPNHTDVDVTDSDSVERYVASMRIEGYDTLVNCAAATSVADIQSSPSKGDESFLVNALAPRYIATACRKYGLKMLHVSTDYVYSEKSSISQPAVEFPVNTYGCHKLLGELFVKESLPADDYVILRVGCLYGMHNNKSFIHKFLKNAANVIGTSETSKTAKFVNVVDAQRSTPTSTIFVSNVVASILDHWVGGVFNTSPLGSATRMQFAAKILELANESGYFPGELKNIYVLNNGDAPSYLPLVSCMNELKTAGYICSSGIGWERDLERFFLLNGSQLASWFKKLLNEPVAQ